MCRFKSSLPERGAVPCLPAPSARSRGAARPWREQRPPGQPVGRGARGRRGTAERGRRAAGGAALEERAQAAQPGGAGQGEAAEGGPAPAGACVPGRQLPDPRGWRGSEPGGSRREAAAARRRLRAPCALPGWAAACPLLPPRSSPRLLLSLVSPPLFRPAPLSSAPRPPNPAGPGPLSCALSARPRGDRSRDGRRPSLGARRLPDLSDRGLRGGSAFAARGALGWATRTLAAAPDAAGAGARTSWVQAERASRAPNGASSLGAGQTPRGPAPAVLDWTERSPDGAKPGERRARVEGIPASSDPSDFG